MHKLHEQRDRSSHIFEHKIENFKAIVFLLLMKRRISEQEQTLAIFLTLIMFVIIFNSYKSQRKLILNQNFIARLYRDYQLFQINLQKLQAKLLIQSSHIKYITEMKMMMRWTSIEANQLQMFQNVQNYKLKIHASYRLINNKLQIINQHNRSIKNNQIYKTFIYFLPICKKYCYCFYVANFILLSELPVQQLIKIIQLSRQLSMSRHIQSTPSIQGSLQNIENQKAYISRNQYLSNLKVQCEFRENALKTAQNLISAYQKENETLKEENHALKIKLEEKEEKLSILKSEEYLIKTLEKNLLKSSQRINELLEMNMANEQKIYSLERDIEKVYQQHEAEKETIKLKLKLKTKEDKQRRDMQGHFKNYLKFAGKDDSLQESPRGMRISVGKNSLMTAISHKEVDKERSQVKVLEWKLKQKDQEVLILLKRLKDIQQKFNKLQRHNRKQRIITSDSVDNYSSKKNNVSEFCH